MSLLGLVCRITQISNPGLRKEGKMHKHRRAGAQKSLDAPHGLRVVSVLTLGKGRL